MILRITIKTWAVLLVLLATVLALAGCPLDGGQRPAPAPTTTAVSPGATCSPAGARGTLADGRAAQCNLDGRWSVL